MTSAPSRWRSLRELFLPRRASTQTWMMLIIATAVGLAVVVVGLYSIFFLRGQVDQAARQTLAEQAERFAVQLEAEPDRRTMLALGEQIARLTRTDVAIAAGDRILGAWGPGTEPGTSSPEFFSRPEVIEAQTHGFGFARRDDADGQGRLYAALLRPDTGLLVRIGESPPLLRTVERMQAVLSVGLGLALLLALLAAWWAARIITGPLKAITRSAQRINEGDLDRRISVRTRAGEFQDLARSLNQMAARFRADIHDLQRMQQVQNEFIGNVSHEVKNPIFAVFGYLEALGSETLSPDMRRKYAQKGLVNLQRLNNLFSDLIEIAKLEYREDLLRPQRFDLQGLIVEVGDMLESRAEEKGLHLTYDNASVHVRADRNRIRQVVTNLIDNAIAYTEEGTVTCRMRRHVDKARVEVLDTGRGIPEEHLDRIFERFYRVDTARSRKMGGTGLGLAIVKQILDAHGETIHVESTRGRGTRFWFDLPLDAEPAGDGSPDGAAPPASTTDEQAVLF